MKAGPDNLAPYFWGSMPASIENLRAIASTVLDGRQKNQKSFPLAAPDAVVQAFEESHKQHGSWTYRVKDATSRLRDGAVESAHQSVVLGGPAFILNKIACAHEIAKIIGSHAFFFVADYDGVQPELVNIRFPGLGPDGMLVTLPIPLGFEHSPMSVVPLPSEAWLHETTERLHVNYEKLCKDSSPQKWAIIDATLDHIFQILRTTYFRSKTASEWSAQILDILVNVQLDLGIPFLVYSQFRQLAQPVFEYLLAEKNRLQFITSMNESYEKLVALNLEPSLKKRTRDYVPFFYECPNHECNSSRVELTAEPKNGRLTLTGKCPSCKQNLGLDVSAHNPDLSDHIKQLSPRVDSRHFVVSSLMPIGVHVGGPGETGYYAQVIPAARSLGAHPPSYFRYTRCFYNTPWNEHLAEELHKEGVAVLTDKPLFTALKTWMKARQGRDGTQLRESYFHIQSIIEELRGELQNQFTRISSSPMGDEKRRQGSPPFPQLRNHLRQYLTNALGQYDLEKFAQEVSFSWIDLCAVSGVNDCIGIYSRVYLPATPPAGFFFLNLR